LQHDPYRASGRYTGTEAERLLRQRAALADFGAAALASNDLDAVLTEGARLCAEGLGVPYCKVLEYRPGTNDLIVRAGVGWQPGMIGRAVARAEDCNPGGRAFRSGRPVIVADLRRAEGMDLPGIYARHGIVSAASVPTLGKRQRPFGVLEVGARQPCSFGEHDLGFLRGFAKVMARAARAHRRHAAVRAESEAKTVLLREQQHRVRNNLMAITAMLRSGERGAADEGSRAHFGGVRRRVFAMASLYDHLLGAGLSGDEASLRDYLRALCAGARDFHGLAEGRIALAFEAGDDAVPIGIDACTVLGVVVNELVANAVEHAFGPVGDGSMAVTMGRTEDGSLVVNVEDDGVGIPPGAESSSVGLDLARRLVERMGASLALRSAPGRTVWTTRLPRGAAA
jgi:two-component sensor histidine kinase